MPSAQQQASSYLQPGWSVIRNLVLDRRYFWHLAAHLVFGELLLGLIIIWRVPYTKIDWPAYMQQVDGFLSGERDYSKLEGDTGPLVYPALHLYIYTLFYKLLSTFNKVRPAQYIFLTIYLCTLLLVAWIYYNAGMRGRHVPQILLIPLTLSKRAQSIYLLRLFNDPLGMVLFYGSVVVMLKAVKPGSRLYGGAGWRVSSVLFSLALGVKMNILLFLPGLLVLLFQYRGLFGLMESLFTIIAVQLLLPAPFFFSDTYLAKSYFTSAFDFSRQFLFEWTVNWRFVGEKTFLSKDWAKGLLGVHIGLLVSFADASWCSFAGGTSAILSRGLNSPSSAPISPTQASSSHIPFVLFTSNLIGILSARSLHYQFHSWYFHQIPLLLWYGGAWGSIPLGIVLWMLIEYGWATFPSTSLSSSGLLVAHLIMLAGLWWNSPTATSEIEVIKDA